jgi:hypothetical protein
MSKRNVGQGIAKVINMLHGTDKPEPLKEGQGYSTAGAGTEIKKTPQQKEVIKKKPPTQLIDRLLVEGKLDEIMELVDNDLTMLSKEQQKKFKEWNKLESDLKLQEMANKVASQPGYQEFMTLPLMSTILSKSTNNKQEKIDKKSNEQILGTLFTDKKQSTKSEKPKSKSLNY